MRGNAAAAPACGPSVLKRLTFAKYLFLQAAEEDSKGPEIAKAVSVLHLHDCLEIFMQCVADAWNVNTKGLEFRQYPAKIKEAAKMDLHRPQVVDRVNGLRVPLKHQGSLPGASAVQNLLADVERFLCDNTADFLGLDFHEVSMAELILNQAVRKEVQQAEKAITSGEFGEALKLLKVAFEVITSGGATSGTPRTVDWAMRIETKLVDENGRPRLKDYEEDDRLRRMLHQMNERYERLASAVRMQHLGVRMLDYYRFEHLTPSLQGRTAQGEWRAIFSGAKTLKHTRENATFCLGFVMDAALKAQDIHPIRDTLSRYVVEVVAESVPVLVRSEEAFVEERQALKGERFDDARIGIMLDLGGAEHWMIGEWAVARILPVDGVEIVDEHRP